MTAPSPRQPAVKIGFASKLQQSEKPDMYAAAVIDYPFDSICVKVGAAWVFIQLGYALSE